MRMCAGWEQVSGSIDILVNNAGVGQTGALLDVPLELIRKHMETNFIAAENLIQLVGSEPRTPQQQACLQAMLDQ